MNGFRKWFLAFRKVSSGEEIINEFLMYHQVFDESSSFAEKYMTSYVASTRPS
jgi:hypothetical protein